MASGRRRRRNIIFCFICYNDWPAGPQKRNFFQFTDGSLTTINHSVQDAETFQNVNSRKHWIVSKQWIHLEEDGMVLLFLGFWYQDENTKGAVPAAGLRWHKTQAREEITECLSFVVTFQMKSVLKHLYQWRWYHVNNPTIQRSSWYCAALCWKKSVFMTKFSFKPCWREEIRECLL